MKRKIVSPRFCSLIAGLSSFGEISEPCLCGRSKQRLGAEFDPIGSVSDSDEMFALDWKLSTHFWHAKVKDGGGY